MQTSKWRINDTGKRSDEKVYDHGNLLKINHNRIYEITSPNFKSLLAASNIGTQIVSNNGLYLALLIVTDYELVAEIADYTDQGNFIMIYPSSVKYPVGAGTSVNEMKFVQDGLLVKTRWGHPLSRMIQENEIVIDVKTGRVISKRENSYKR